MNLPRSIRHRAFTLIEVMIAMGIFFMAIFAILQLVSTCLRNARLLQKTPLDTRIVTSVVWLTNSVTEGSGSGDLGELYKGCRYVSNAVPRDDFPTNGLYEIDYVFTEQGGGETKRALLKWDPSPHTDSVRTP